jgi:hypothetical protein
MRLYSSELGLSLIVGSQWASFKVSTSGIEVLRAQIQQSAEATREVATQAEEASRTVEVTQTQVANLSTLLQQRQVLSPEATRAIRQQLAAAPAPKPNRLNSAYARIDSVRRSERSAAAATYSR